MNDRIDLLLWQAGGFNTISNPNDSFLDGKYILSQEQLDSFAKLIVREVFVKIEDERFEVYQPVKESVMKHFGVEE